MIGRKAVVGICALCALVFSAFAAQSAFAQEAVTCGSGLGNKDFSGAHCKSADKVTAGTGSFGHATFSGATAISGSNITTGSERSTAKLKSVQAGVTLEIQSTTVSGSGEMENNAGGWAEGTGTIVYEGVTVTAPAGKGCEVEGGKVTTNKLAASTKGLTNELKFTPAAGETFAEFNVKGCSNAALNHAYTAKGSVTGTTDGATTTTTHAGVTAANTLTLAGQKAGIDGSITIQGANGNGLALT